MHGQRDGRAHDRLGCELGEVGLDVHRRIKAALDPDALFNPGSMFPACPP